MVVGVAKTLYTKLSKPCLARNNLIMSSYPADRMMISYSLYNALNNTSIPVGKIKSKT